MSQPVYIDTYERQPSNVVTVGTFDGVHLGHQALIRNVVGRARERKAPAVVVTFDPHPRDIIHPSTDGVRLLTTLPERSEIMRRYGIDKMVVIPFTRDFSMLSSEQFVRDYVYKRVGVDTFVIGYDHHFGRDREGSIQTLKKLGAELGFSVHVQSAQEVKHTTVSSTVIRRLLEDQGDVDTAAEMLGRRYEMSGTIVRGDRRGRTIGFPTANLQWDDPRKVLPANGVYCVEAELDGQWLSGMMNIGKRPTFDGTPGIVPEVHLFDFDRTVYGSKMRVRFIRRIRGEKKFSGPEALVQQLKNDREMCRAILRELPG
ncbi:bifunctional riboflavin kinase/FAD synthetase [Balneolales bacterium ANBcel1]|nr:bifunctional riboflavin kinase/FAD synthetase [Balneolales bacterium ANBcel1]